MDEITRYMMNIVGAHINKKEYIQANRMFEMAITNEKLRIKEEEEKDG